MSVQSTSLLFDFEQFRIKIQENNKKSIKSIEVEIHKDPNLATLQNPDTGESALMVASKSGHLDIVKLLLAEGAVWNALDEHGKCAGNYASEFGHQEICDLLVHHAVQCELLLGRADATAITNDEVIRYRNNESGGYLQSDVKYTEDGKNLIDEAGDGVMMEWERPLMQMHAQIITNNKKNKRVLNIGFGMGIIDGILQSSDEIKPSFHVIIEAHPKVYAKMRRDGWLNKPNVRVLYGKWQDELPKLVEEGIRFDGIFFDTYGEHWSDMEQFHQIMIQLLSESSDAVYSFFNGLSPDNIFFHGVACECARIQLLRLGLAAQFAPCEIQIDHKEWVGISRKYFHDNVYYLPICTWEGSALDDSKKESSAEHIS